MAKPRIAVMDPTGDSQAAVSSVLRYRRWQATKVTDPAEIPPDVAVVLAVEDRGGGGIDALRAVRRAEHPAARILICDARVAAKVVARGEPAHQVVVRPASSEKVLAAVKRALRVRELLADPHVQALASTFSSVPALPTTWTRLSRLLESETATMQDAVALVEQDVGLAAKVLQLVNSGLFGLDRPIGSLFAALQRLGLSVVRDLVLSVELFEGIPTEASDVFGPLPLPQTSHLVASAARAVAPKAAVDSAFSAGLFHQLGRLVFVTQAPVLYERVVQQHRGGLDLSLAEEAVFGVDGRVLAAWLLATWGLPHEVVEAVRWCDHPEHASGRGAPLALSVFLGARLVEEAARRRKGETSVLVHPVELAPWGLAASLDEWREHVQQLLEDTLRDAEPALV